MDQYLYINKIYFSYFSSNFSCCFQEEVLPRHSPELMILPLKGNSPISIRYFFDHKKIIFDGKLICQTHSPNPCLGEKVKRLYFRCVLVRALLFLFFHIYIFFYNQCFTSFRRSLDFSRPYCHFLYFFFVRKILMLS